MATSGREGEGAASWVVVESSNLTIRGEKKDGALVAKTAGRVDGSNAREFQDALESLLGDDTTAMVLDLEELSYISSAGLRVILLVARRIHSKNGKFGVCALSDAIKEVFQISGFDKIIETHGAQEEAISSITK